MPPKKRGKRGLTDEQLEAEPKPKRQKGVASNSGLHKRSGTSALNSDSGVTETQEALQSQQQEQVESKFDYDISSTGRNGNYRRYGNEKQDMENQLQDRTEELEKADLESSDPLPFDMNVIQAEEWDVLSPNNRLYALNWSLVKAIGVLEYIHVDLVEWLNNEGYESIDGGLLPGGDVPVF